MPRARSDARRGLAGCRRSCLRGCGTAGQRSCAAVVEGHAAKAIIEHPPMDVAEVDVPYARLRPLARVFQVSQHPPGDAALAVQEVYERLVQVCPMDHGVGPAAELAGQGAVEPVRAVGQEPLVRRHLLLGHVAVQEDVGAQPQIEVMPGEVRNLGRVLLQAVDERLAVVVIAEQIMKAAPRMLGGEPLEPMVSGLDRCVNARQRGPAKIENVAAQHHHRRLPRRCADRFRIPRRIAPPGEHVQVGDEAYSMHHAISVADWTIRCKSGEWGVGSG